MLEQVSRGAPARQQQGIGGSSRVTHAAVSVAAVTPSDTTTYSGMLFLWVSANGNVALTFADGSTCTIPVTAGQRLDVSATKVNAATTATVFAFF